MIPKRFRLLPVGLVVPFFVAVFLVPILGVGCTGYQQLPNTALELPGASPAWPEGEGPRVLVDHGHHNYHTIEERYLPFAALLRRDGFVVEAASGPFTAESLAAADVVVISNPLAAQNVRRWRLPTPSAYSPAEIGALREWVEGGGALLLIADHMPFPGAAADLAAAFGVYFHNGFATDGDGVVGRLTFTPQSGLAEHPIVAGRDAAERIDSVTTFTGQAFRVAEEADASPLLVLPEGSEVLLSPVAWRFSERTPRIPAAGLWQGGALRVGDGRLAVFGEAAMFTSQVAVQSRWGREISRTSMGMGAPGAEQNPRFLLNVMHWLAGILPGDLKGSLRGYRVGFPGAWR